MERSTKWLSLTFDIDYFWPPKTIILIFQKYLPIKFNIFKTSEKPEILLSRYIHTTGIPNFKAISLCAMAIISLCAVQWPKKKTAKGDEVVTFETPCSTLIWWPYLTWPWPLLSIGHILINYLLYPLGSLWTKFGLAAVIISASVANKAKSDDFDLWPDFDLTCDL